MRWRLVGWLASAAIAALATPLSLHAQAPPKLYRIGYLTTAPAAEAEHLTKAFEQGLRELGYVEGRNVAFERRSAEGRQERLPSLAADLVRLNVDVIVTESNPVIAAVKQATATIPVVMAASRDPVGSGFIASLSRPGGNITGLTNDPAPDVLAKNVELLKEAGTAVSRIGVLWNPVPPGARTYTRIVEDQSEGSAAARSRAAGVAAPASR